MEFEILKGTEYRAVRPEPNTPTILLTIRGRMVLNKTSQKLLSLSPGDRVLVIRDKAGSYYVAKTVKTNVDGYTLSACTGSGLQFHVKQIVQEIAIAKDLALAPEKKKSISFDLATEAVEFLNLNLYEILF